MQYVAIHGVQMGDLAERLFRAGRGFTAYPLEREANYFVIRTEDCPLDGAPLTLEVDEKRRLTGQFVCRQCKKNLLREC